MELIGEIYRDKVLSLPEKERFQLDLPYYREGETKIVNELFNWMIYCGKKKIEARSEEEAKYIICLWKYGIDDLWIPKNLDYINQMLPRTLVVVAEQDRIIEETVERYSNRKVREALRHRIYLLIAHLEDEDGDEATDEQDSETEESEEVEEMENAE